MPVVFGLLSAITWGSADFGGGRATRRGPVFGVVLVSQALGMLLAGALAVARGEPMPGPADLGWAALAGLAGALGIACLYQGLASGRITVVAPIAGVLAATIPVTVGWLGQGLPSPWRIAGIGLALVAVVLVSTSSDPLGDRSAGVRFGIFAGIGFGLFNVFAARFSPGVVFGPLVVVRALEGVAVVAAILLTRRAWRLPRSVVPLAMAVGVGDMAGNGFFVLAAQAGRLDVASVLSSLYPVTTIVLAAIVLHERVSRAHAAGIAVAAAAIVLIAGG
ncbi:MAG TPA: EamA family transporter [Candidatus Limnocylindrales bacterium]